MKFKMKKNRRINITIEYSDYMSMEIVEAARRAGMSPVDLVLTSHAIMMDMARQDPDRVAKAARLFADDLNAQAAN